MAARDALFGATITSSANTAPEDLANDTTFGDIGDIRAGDAASEQHWAPDHDAFAKAIEAEKEGILRRQRQREAQTQQSPPRQELPTEHNENHAFPLMQQLKRQEKQAAMRAIQIQAQQLQQPLAGSPSNMGMPIFPGQHGLPPGMPPGQALHQMHPAYARALQAQQQQRQQRQQQHQQLGRAPASSPPGQPADLRELRAQALHQQQRRMHILQQQMELQQAQSQPPTPEMQMYLQAQKRQQMQQLHQLQQQQAQTQPPPLEMQIFMMGQKQLMQQNQHLEPAQLRHLLHQHHQQFMAASTARARAAAAAAASAAGFAHGPASRMPQGPAQGAPPVNPPRAMPPLPHAALSLADLEQSLRASRVSEAPPRRMESMTDKDLELVLRMHLRQLDTSIPYRDDFYWTMFEEGDESGYRDMYEVLGAQLRDMEDSGGALGVAELERGRRKRGRAKKRDEKEKDSVSPGVHTSSNLKTLTHALGTIQSWNPKAPRRLMDLGAGDEKSSVPAVHKVMEDDGKSRLMRDDERVAVRVAVEDGYDLLSILQDVTRKKATDDTGELLNRVFDTLHLSGEGGSGDGAEAFESTRFFVRMCVFEKGKRYIARLLSVLRPEQAARVITAVFENLSMLLYAIAPRADGDGPDELWEAVLRAVRCPLIPAERLMDILNAFCRTHATDGGSLVIVLSSTIGARLLYVTMQRIFSAQGDGTPLTRDSSHWRALCIALTSRLGDVFDATESSKSIWEVAAMLDALSEGQIQADLRSALKNLLDSGRVPPPPGT